MSRTFDPLTPDELAEIARRRAEAREMARRLDEEADPAEDARVEAAALADPDAQPMTDEELARMRPAHEVVPHLVAAEIRRKRGPQKTPTKTQVTLRLDPDVIAYFKAGGPGWQSRINAALRSHLAR